MKKETKKAKEKKCNNKYNITEIVGMVVTLIILVFATIYVNYNNRQKNVKSEDKNALVTPTVLYLDNVIGTSVEKGTKVKIGGIFTYLGSNKFYYKAEMYYSTGKIIYKGTCNEVNQAKIVNFSFTPTKDPIYARITIYKDNTCNNSVKKYDSKKYKTTTSNSGSNNNNSNNNNNNNSNNNNGNNTSTSKKPALSLNQPLKTRYTEKTVVEVSFKHNQKKTMYYTFTNYNKAQSGYKQNCSPIGEETKSFGLAVDKNNTYRYSVIKLYSDSTCKTLVDSKTTRIYQYINQSSDSGSNNNNSNNNNSNSNNNGEYTSSSYAINPVKSLGTVKGATLKMEKGCNESAVNKYISELKQNPDYVVKTPAIYFITDKSMKRNWGSIYAGMTSGIISLISTEILCTNYQENVVAHELAHGYDAYYAHRYTINDTFENIYDSNKDNPNVLSSYSRGNKNEFFADAYVYYFRRYITQEPSKLNGFGPTYPAELESYIERALASTIKIKK